MSVGSFFAGFAACAFFASAIFFLKFWRASSDKFFLYFSSACGLLALERVLLLFLLSDSHNHSHTPEAQIWVYLVRMAAFLVIIWAIIQRNRKGT